MALETTANLNEKTVEKLKDLVKVNIDSYKGFDQAAETIENAQIAGLFRQLSSDRKVFAEQLRQYIELNDEEASDAGSIKGKVHRWWLSARGAMTDGDNYAVLAEAERGEDVIKERYEEVLKETAGSALNDLLLKQYAEVKKGHDLVRDLRDATKDEKK